MFQTGILFCFGVVPGGYLRYNGIKIDCFFAGHISSFTVVVFVVAGKPSYIAALTVGRAILTIVTDLFFIPVFGVNGVACSNIVINLFAGWICFALMEYSEFRQASVQPSANGYEWLRQWAKIGVFSANIEFICYLFGFGMCVNAICGTLLFAWSERNAPLVSS